MSKAITSAGTTLGVSASAPATYNSAGFSALNFTTVGEIVNLGEFGKAFEVVTHQPLDTRQTIKRKGSYNNGSLNLQLAKDASDAGQVLLLAALESDDSYSFVVTLQDGTKEYFSGQVVSYTNNVGTANQITGASCTIEIDNDIIEV